MNIEVWKTSCNNRTTIIYLRWRRISSIKYIDWTYINILNRLILKNKMNKSLQLLIISMICLNVRSILAIVPSFDRTNENVTVIIGNSAVLPCFISNLGDHKVNDYYLTFNKSRNRFYLDRCWNEIWTLNIHRYVENK